MTILLAASAGAELLPLRSYSTVDGLPHNRVKQVREDHLGFIWFCTTEGLARFDGRNFVTFGVAHGLPVPSVNDVIETPDGLWVATNGGGVAFLDPAAVSPSFRSLRVADDAASRVNRLSRDAGGALWAATDGGLFRTAGAERFRARATFERVPLRIPGHAEASVQVWELLPIDGGMLAGTRFGLVFVANDGTSHPVPLGRKGGGTVQAVVRAEDGRILIGQTGAGLFTLDPRTLAVLGHLSAADGLPGSSVTAILDSNHRIYVGTDEGLAIVGSGGVSAFGTGNGLSTGMISAIAADRDGGIWLASPGGGAMRLAPSPGSLYGPRDGLGEAVSALFEGPDGKVCVVSSNWTVSVFDGRRFTSTRPNLPATLDASRWRLYFGSLRDHEGSFWFGTNQGLYRFGPVGRIEELARAVPMAVYTKRSGLASDEVTHLVEDPRGDVWIGTFTPIENPLSRWVRATGRFERFGAEAGLPGFGSPLVLAVDAAGNVWIAYRDGPLARYKEGRFRLFSGRNGFPAAPITALAPDSFGRLWASSAGGGLVRVDHPDAEDPVASSYGPARGVQGFYLSGLVEDANGRIVFGTSRELMRLDPKTGAVTKVPETRGFGEIEVTAALRDRTGVEWLGFPGGLTRLGTGEQPQPRPPRVRIAAAIVSGDPSRVSGEGAEALDLGELPASTSLSLEFFGVGLNGEPLQYQRLLEGLDGAWSPPRPERAVQYAHLAPGEYRFLVRAIGPIGRASLPAWVTFRIRPPFFRRWWFLTAVSFLLAAIGYGAAILRTRQKRALDEVRERIASDLHDDLGGGLSRISILSEVVSRRLRDGAPSAELVDKIGEASRAVVEKLADGIWEVDPRHDDLLSLVERLRQVAAELLEPAGLSWRIEVPPGADRVRLHPDRRRQVYLILKEALTNVARHSRGRHATLAVGVEWNRLVFALQDDGNGIEAQGEGNGERLTGGRGLRNMQERAKALGGTLAIEASPGSGTVIRLEVPEKTGA